MKLLAFLTLFMPTVISAQTPAPYQHTMEKFKQFYNAGQADSINAMFGHEWDEMKLSGPLWTNAQMSELLTEYGKLESFKFLGIITSDNQEIHIYQTSFSKKHDNATGFTLDSGKKLATFRFDTSSDEITRQLKQFESNH
jgi:hypothetical protein